MVDATTTIIASVLAGLAGGFLSSWMKFNATGEKFDGRKHGNALVTGSLTGMGLGLLTVIAAEVTNKGNIPGAILAVGLFTIFLSAAGVDKFRSYTSQMITNRIASKTSSSSTKSKPVDEAKT